MPNQNNSLLERVNELLPSLTATAANLNEASKKLSAMINRIDDALQRLNLGVTAWVKVRGGDDPSNGFYWSEDLGYSRTGRKWGLVLKKGEGNYQDHPDSDNYEYWPFNEAPRSLRISATTKIPDLLMELDRQAKDMEKQVSESADETMPLVEVLEESARPQRSIKKKLRRQL